VEDSLGKQFSTPLFKNLTADINASANALPKRKAKRFMTGKSRT
jgi:hypothetical protein